MGLCTPMGFVTLRQASYTSLNDIIKNGRHFLHGDVMATALAFVWLLTSAGGARAESSFSTGGMMAVVGSFTWTLVAVTVVVGCVCLTRKNRRKKETPGSPVNEAREVVSLKQLESNGRNNPPESPNDIECGPIVHQDHVQVAPSNQTTTLAAQRTSNKKRSNKVDAAQKLDIEIEVHQTYSVTASEDQSRRQEQTGSSRKPVKASFSYDGRKPLAYTRLNEEETLVTLVSRDPIGLGFNIYGNMTEGIFVREVLSRGPAVESGIISQGDRILSISISTAHMVFEDALTILSYASSYPVTLRISKTPGQETLFMPSGQLSSDQEIGASSADVRSRERGSRRPSVNPLYRSQSLDNLADVKAGADRSIDEFRSSADHLTRRFSEFRSVSPECLRRNKRSSHPHRWNMLELERLYRSEAMEFTPGNKDLDLGSQRNGNDTANRCKTSGETSDRIPGLVDLGRPVVCTAIRTNQNEEATLANQNEESTLTNQNTPIEEVNAFLNNVSNLEDTRTTATVDNRSTDSHNEELDRYLRNTSDDDTRINIDDLERQVTSRGRDDVEIDNDDSHVVINDFKTSDVSSASPYIGVIDSTAYNVRLNTERTDVPRSDYLPARIGAVNDEPFDRLQPFAEPLSSTSEQYAMNRQANISHTETVDGGGCSVGRRESNSGIEDGIVEQFRNVAVNPDENEKCDMDDGRIFKLRVESDRVETEDVLYEPDTGEMIDQKKEVTFAGECSTVICVEDPPDVDSFSPKLTTSDGVTEPSQLSPTNSSPSTKGFLKTLKRLFNIEQKKPGNRETSGEDGTLNKTGKRNNRKTEKKFLGSSEKTGSSNSGRQISERDLTVVVHADADHELSFTDEAVGNDDSDSEEDIDRAIADFMGVTTPQTGKSEDRDVFCPMEWNLVTGDGTTRDQLKLNSRVEAERTDDGSGAINSPLERKCDTPQTSSQIETKTVVSEEVLSNPELTGSCKNPEVGMDNCAREHLERELYSEKPIDVTVNRQAEMSLEPNDLGHQMDDANVVSTEFNSPIETSINMMELGRNKIFARSANSASVETQRLEMTEIISSARTSSSSNKKITVIAPRIKKFQADRQDVRVIKPILKKLSSVSSSDNVSWQNDTELLAKASDIPDEEVRPTKTADSSFGVGQMKETPNVIPKSVSTLDECRVRLEDIWRGVEQDTLTRKERTIEEDPDGQIDNEDGIVRELWDHANYSEAEESETDWPSSVLPPPYNASHPEMAERASYADESRSGVPIPNYALFPENFEAESDEEEPLDDIPTPNYANYPEKIERESEEDVFYTDTTIPNHVNYLEQSNAALRSFPLDPINEDFAALRTKNGDTAVSTTASDCSDETKTPSQVMQNLLEKLRSFGKRDYKDRTNGSVILNSSSSVLSDSASDIHDITSDTRDITIPFKNTGNGGSENYYYASEETEARELSGIDAFESKAARSSWKPSDNIFKSSYSAGGNEVQLMRTSERSEDFIMDDGDERARIVFSQSSDLVCGTEEFDPEQRFTPKSVGDINNNSCVSGLSE